MNIVVELMRGMALGIEFPGEGIHAVFHLGIVRVIFLSDELVEELGEE